MADSPECRLPPVPPVANQKKRKTRDLPNLSDCHCCNHRINCTNPKNRLRILTSEWRIVLLCKSCHSLVESSQYCSYCLTGISSSSMDSFFECKRCSRRIHGNCVSKFLFSPGNSGEFFVCFDCWVPEFLEDDYNRVHDSKTKKKVKMCGDSANLGSSRASDSQDEVKSLEEMVNEANVMAQKKIELAAEAKEKAATKAVVARRAVEVANGALSVVAVDKGDDRGKLVAEDDAQLAIQLHRVMNSSPRITRNSCLLNMFSMDSTLKQSSNIGVGGYAKSLDSDSVSCKEPSGPCSTETRQDGVQGTGGTEDEKRNGDSYGGLITYSKRGRASQDGRCLEKSDNCHLRIYARRLSHVGRHKAKHNKCFKTYRRRPSAISHCKNKLQYGDFNYEHSISSSAIKLNCRGDSRALANAS